MPEPNKMTADFKPRTQALADKVEARLNALGETRREVRAQLSFGRKRKFLWMWAYDATPDGTLYLTVTLDHALSGEHFHYVKQVSPHRWNHHVVVRTAKQVSSGWFLKLLKAGVEFAE